MPLPIDLSPKEIVIAAAAIAITLYCACRIWNGRKVTQINPNSGSKPNIPWEEDDNNPANWYLKDPNKFLVSKK